MDRTFWLATLCAFVTSVVLAFVFHGLILAPDYALLPGVYRGPQFRPGLFSLLLLGQLVMAGAMVGIYRYGREARPWLAQGARFGLLVALVSVVPCYLIGYAVTNVPAALAIKQILLEALRTVAMGIAVAGIHR
ncbi:MAG: hypothetical protein M5U07_09520 [Xanthobacteraceae bacterium]|nr:hypothetical protein [Xanthobacteraceae bacterium]PWB65322.1 MAG: hypothetical protein C3F17_04420 [Bradyrhizobiaceae bacterium]